MPRGMGYGGMNYGANDRYGNPASGKVMGHDKKPMKCNAFEAQKSDMGKIKRKPMDNRGYPKQAWDYKY